jgi:hypothetical protein
MKNPTGEEIRRAFKPDRQLGGGVLPIQIERRWEEENAISILNIYQNSWANTLLLSQCSYA